MIQFEVGKSYKTRLGDYITVVSRTPHYISYTRSAYRDCKHEKLRTYAWRNKVKMDSNGYERFYLSRADKEVCPERLHPASEKAVANIMLNSIEQYQAGVGV